ncbi:hypothetical protein H8356DRAFT_1674229 [Neocallimastix lanati (nom. inval.)]|nr:hypothetical protein H8356DRAFT_1674229 [Neocallimastix sp. JGI-2020a]
MGTNSNSNTNKPLLYHFHSSKRIDTNTKPLLNHSYSFNKIDTRPLVDSSSNNYESLRQKIIKNLNERPELSLSNKKTPKDKSISRYIESKGQNGSKSSSIQNENKSLLSVRTPSPLSSAYNEARKNSLIPTPSKCTSSKKDSALKIITKPNNNSFSIKKSRIPITPTSKSALNRIDSLIKNSLFSQNIISTY